jgi:hypothetical protein
MRSILARQNTHTPPSHKAQLTRTAVDNKNIVGFVNFTEKGLPKRKGRQQDRFFYLHQDTAANCIILGSKAGRSCVINRRSAAKDDYVMMNAFPMRVEEYGDLVTELQDTDSGEWFAVEAKDVMVISSSQYDLLGLSAFQKQLPRGAQIVFEDDRVRLPLRNGKVVTGKRRGGLFSMRARIPHTTRAPAHAKSIAPTESVRVVAAVTKRHTNSVVKAESVERKHDAPVAAPVKPEKKARFDGRLEVVPGEGNMTEEEGERREFERDAAMIRVKARDLMLEFHNRLGHVVQVGAIQKQIRMGNLIITNARVRDEMLRLEAKDLACNSCDAGRITKRHPQKGNGRPAEGQYTTDLDGPYPWKSHDGKRYAMIVVAPDGRGLFVAFLAKKSEVCKVWKRNRKLWERITGVKLAVLRMDRAGEQTSKRFRRFLTKIGARPSFTAFNSSAGPAEAYIRIAQESMVCMLSHYARMHNCPRPTHLWTYAYQYAVDCKDVTACSTNGGQSMFERRTGRLPKFEHCHVWGCNVTAHMETGKGYDRGREGRFMGFAQDGDGFLVYDPKKGTIIHPKKVTARDSLRNMSEAEIEKTQIQDVVSAEYSFKDVAGPAPASQPLASGAPEMQVDEVHMGEQGERSSRVRTQAVPANVGHEEWQVVPSTVMVTKRLARAGEASRPGSARGQITSRVDGVVRDEIRVRDQMVASRDMTRKAELLERLRLRAKSVRAYLRTRGGSNEASLPGGMVPKTDSEADNSEDRHIWVCAREKELGDLIKAGALKRMSYNAVFGKVIGTKWVYDIKVRSPTCELSGPCFKTLSDGKKVRYKARLVVLGYQQQEGVHYNFDQTYAPTPQIGSLRLIASYAHHRGWTTKQADVKQAFVQADLPEEHQMCVKLPKSSGMQADWLFLLLKSLYGLVQAAHLFHRNIKTRLEEHGFACVDADLGVYVRYNDKDELQCVLCLHVDDCYIAGPDELVEGVLAKLRSAYTITESPADYFLKIQIRYSDDRRFMSMSQPMYIRDILKAMKMEDCNSTRVPMDSLLRKGNDILLTREEEDFMADKYEQYGHVVGMLGALMLATRPDLAFCVGQVRQYTAFPRRHHFVALQRIVKYLKGTANYGLVFDKNASSSISGYVDADFAANIDTRASISGRVFLFLGAAFVFGSTKQRGKIVGRLREGEKEEKRDNRVAADAARSTEESELRALDLGCRDALWIRKLAKALRLPEGESAIPLYEDNQACYYVAKNNKWTSATKHLATMYFACRDDIIDGRVDLLPIDSKDNLADMFTKPLRQVVFERFRLQIGVRDASV